MCPNTLYEIDVVVEIPKGSRNKYEYDPKVNAIRFDRMLFSSVHYPSDYGYIPNTLAEDGDPLDALVVVSEATFPGCIISANPIGLFQMSDEKGPDAKILCVPTTDPNWNHIGSLEEMPKHLLREIEHFFQIYKDLENKKTAVDGWHGKDAAVAVIKEAQERFRSEVSR